MSRVVQEIIGIQKQIWFVTVQTQNMLKNQLKHEGKKKFKNCYNGDKKIGDTKKYKQLKHYQSLQKRIQIIAIDY